MENSSSIRRTSLSDLFYRGAHKPELEHWTLFCLAGKVPDKPSSSYSETLLGLRENATGEPAEPGSTADTADTANIATLAWRRYHYIDIKIEKLFIWHETKVRLDIIAPRLGAYFDLTQQPTFEWFLLPHSSVGRVPVPDSDKECWAWRRTGRKCGYVDI